VARGHGGNSLTIQVWNNWIVRVNQAQSLAELGTSTGAARPFKLDHGIRVIMMVAAPRGLAYSVSNGDAVTVRPGDCRMPD
jgi:hypothetical protein